MSNPLDIPNEMIVASAGAGKTWELTNRYIALLGRQLLAGEELRPEGIVAVTFTRKAAEEFFGNILQKVAEAARSDKDAADLAVNKHSGEIHPVLSQLKPEHHRQILRSLVDHMAELPLSTLDAFFVSIVRVFAAEFGLPRDFELLDTHESAKATKRVLAEVFSRPRVNEESHRVKLFVDAFRATRPDEEEDRVASNLEKFVKDQHGILLDVPEEKYGDAAKRIWGDLVPTTIGPEGPTDEDLDTLKSLWPKDAKPGAENMYQDFLVEARGRRAGRLGDREKKFLGYVKKFTWEKLSDPPTDPVRIKISTSNVVMKKACALQLHLVLSKIVGQEIHARLARTKAIGDVLRTYEETYERRIRRQGGLAFQDIELFVGNRGKDDESLIRRDEINYRLDATYEQWLFDEFQDTSHAEWSAVSELVGEAVQDPEGQRGLFLVGDPKQAIFSWRGGDSRIFDFVADWYRRAPLNHRNLDVSWRSGPDVLHLVNELFRNETALRELPLPEAAIERWECPTHEPAKPNQDRPGYAAVLEVNGKGIHARYPVLQNLLREIDPAGNDVSVAILVETNKVATELVDWLRRESPEIQVVSESDAGIATDNPLGLALLSLFEHAAHPGDRYCLAHLKLSPFKAEAKRRGLKLKKGKLAMEVLRQVADHGFEEVIRDWSRSFLKAFPEASFLEHRSEELAGVGRLFDESGSRDIDEFLVYARGYKVRDASSRKAVQVMTIHKSKGQTFDAVILPSLDPSRGTSQLSRVRGGIGIARNAGNHHAEWVLDLPVREICECEETLRPAYEQREEESAIEGLCKLYVGLTRPRYATYVILDTPPNNSTARSFPRFLRLALGTGGNGSAYGADVVWEAKLPTSRQDWWNARPQEELDGDAPGDDPVPEKPAPFTAAPMERPISRTPSGAESHVLSARSLLSPGRSRSREHGTLVHGLFEDVEWFDGIRIELESSWAKRLEGTDAEEAADALSEVREALGAKEMAKGLAKPDGPAELWSERRFEVLLDGEWLSGAFDRVVLHLDQEGGRPVRAEIIDFKTDKVSDAGDLEAKVDGYRPQLELYRQVLARMTGIEMEEISARLFFTSQCAVVGVLGNR